MQWDIDSVCDAYGVVLVDDDDIVFGKLGCSVVIGVLFLYDLIYLACLWGCFWFVECVERYFFVYNVYVVCERKATAN